MGDPARRRSNKSWFSSPLIGFNENNSYSRNSKGLLANCDFFRVEMCRVNRLASGDCGGGEGEAPSHAGRGMECGRIRLF
ncbi:hypothetical protein EMIT0P12_100037 [Pseudomonas sp. IT-P12]